MTKTWFTAKAVDGEADVSIYDEIGMFGITAKDFADELNALGKVSHINLSINSPGGSVFDGLAIHNMLKRHKAMITVRVDGVAASIASVIAMAGDVILMPDNAFMMIHDPSGVVMGTSRDMRQLADALDKIKTGLVAAYASKSGLDRDEIEAIMTAETWLTAQEAVDMGFADSIEDPVRIAASFELSKFKNAPADAGRKRGPAASTASQKEPIMTDSIEPVIVPETAGPEEAPVVVEEVTIAVEEPVVVATVDTAAITAAVRKEMGEIAAACKIAGAAGKASEFIAAGKSLTDVLAALSAERPATEEISARHSTANADKPASWAKAIAKANARVK